MNPRQMQQAMRKMGMEQDDIDATEVIIKLADRQLVFKSPGVAKISMMGQESYQITGECEEEALDESVSINDDDIETVVQQTGASHSDAQAAIQEANGDLAEAILKLS